MHRPRISARLNILLLNVDMNEYYLCSNVVSTLINEQQFTELATNGRSIVALATLGLGVAVTCQTRTHRHRLVSGSGVQLGPPDWGSQPGGWHSASHCNLC